MHRAAATMFLCVAIGCVTALVGCAHRNDGEVGTASTTAGLLAVPTAPEPASWRLAYELCKRRTSCIDKGPGGTSIGSSATADCILMERPHLEAELDTWNCSPAATSARLKECAASLQVASCDPIVTGVDPLPACRPNAACDGGQPQRSGRGSSARASTPPSVMR